MNPSFSPAEEAFRLRLRRWLEANPPDVRGTESLDEERGLPQQGPGHGGSSS